MSNASEKQSAAIVLRVCICHTSAKSFTSLEHTPTITSSWMHGASTSLMHHFCAPTQPTHNSPDSKSLLPDGLTPASNDASHNASRAGQSLLHLPLLWRERLLQQLLDGGLCPRNILRRTTQRHKLGVGVLCAVRLCVLV